MKYDPKIHKSKLEVIPHKYNEDTNTVEFELTRMGETYNIIVDKEDWDRILENNRTPQIFRRRLSSGNMGNYYRVKIANKDKPKLPNGKFRKSFLHRWIFGEENIPEGMQIDHINGNPLDNRKSNLRLCTLMQNMVNRKSAHPHSKYNGVCYNNGKTRRVNTGSYRCIDRPWRATITIKAGEGKTNIGTYATEEEAAIAWDKVAYKHFKEFAQLNFPENKDLYESSL